MATGAELRRAYTKDDVVLVVTNVEGFVEDFGVDFDGPVPLRLGIAEQREDGEWQDSLPLVARVVYARSEDHNHLLFLRIIVDADDPVMGFRGRWVHPTQVVPFDPERLIQ